MKGLQQKRNNYKRRISFPNSYKALTLVRSKNGGIHASADINFKERIFGRDSIETAEDLLRIYPDLVEGIIINLASLQGIIDNPLNEEEIGKIHHEFFNGNESMHGILRYDSIDSTPLYVRLICNYCNLYGNSILNKQLINKLGETVSIEESVIAALAWITKKLDTTNLHLLEYTYIPTDNIGSFWDDDKTAIVNKDGLIASHIENQVWTDSYTALIHKNGELANHLAPIAPIEVQGIVYDALFLASKLFSTRYTKSTEWAHYANSVQKQTLALFWNKQNNYFARGIDRDIYGNIRQIKTESAMPAELLDTMIFDNLPQTQKKKYLNALISHIFSNEFLTDFGIRTRSLKYIDLIPYADYHGSLTSWVKETFDIAKGMKRQGFPHLAKALEDRIKNALIITKNHDEFFYIGKKGYLYIHQQHRREEESPLIGTNIPEPTQSWTISALIALRAHEKIVLRDRNQSINFLLLKIPGAVTFATFLPTRKAGIWEKALEEKIIKKIPQIEVIKTKKDRNEWIKKVKYTKIDTVEGLRLEKVIFREKYQQVRS